MKPLVVLVMVFVIVHLTVAKVDQVEVEEILVPFNELQPTGGMKYRVIEVDSTNRRKLVPYQSCVVCRCCYSPSNYCVDMPCCFAIDCNLPNKPFGVCAYGPQACGCTSCG